MESQNSKLKVQNLNSNLKTDLRHRSYQFSINIITFIDSLPTKRSNRIISDQLLRCATSIGANVIEAKASSSRKDFIKFYEIALKSANETNYWLNLLRDTTSLDKVKVDSLLREVDEISKMLGSSIITLKNRRF
ncbi:hypothetical protein A2V56_01940 [Candidatus Woesebacteria bacterium RBG_19FT_COMBO_42_9]|uniref:Four helix bundle protein n=1 Tax=Candidatus Woesebacteria bacterium RBG_16_42_24 TaxID=1802485 RepID=A0A1F7XLJ9_9BACT|nr:MAG: hypothetical protein A2V97_02615 [Candidatus Woesebacteria bacterium RBG_16_42_24]OGM17074.1 MAG: hypothetical protein A2V56_01940 [Candidatus Woesebacteria bacterium RBG_19FT_COMBO_42_9]OGM67881.1 MAG: hypothetical protein A2985_02200 [Candidatus Woesebacteria bacterium RIFCSPLOWO2_01_FULL_43_11]